MTRHEMIEAPVTLNGQPAKVVGAKLDFAHVVDLATGLSAEWAWSTVEHVITNRNGEFRT